MPIGRPLANTQLYVLDQQLQPVPVGVLGELFVGGKGLGRGYLNRPEVTATRFVPDHFSETPGARLYRTGDLVRYLPDRNLQFHGRTDTQVKLRGLRIELGEIEAALMTQEQVRSAAVVMRAEQTGEKSLVGYIVAAPETNLTVAELRQQLSQKLPTYMVPATFVFLPELPLMPNGKIDRLALPAPEQQMTIESKGHAGPGNAIEELIAGVWSDVLGIKAVNIHSDFFASGGHSLLATQVIARLREIFHVDIPLRSLFEQPTIAGLSKNISAALNDGLFIKTHDIHSLSRPELLPLSFAQQRLWFVEQLESVGAAYHIPIIFRINGVLDIPALELTLNEIVGRHEVLRTTFKMVDGEPVQIIASTQPVSLPVVDLRSLPEAEREQEVLSLSSEQAQLKFNLETGPLMHMRLVRLSDEEHVLQMTLHHLVADGWSIGVLAREAMAFYEAFTQEQPSPLPPLVIQYADFALLQREWFQGGGLDAAREYWRTQLAGAPEALELPTDYPRPSAQTFRGAQFDFLVSQTITEDLNNLSQRENVTLFMTLLAAFTVLLSRYANESDIVVGTPIANRQHSELENLIGFFANTLALRVKVDPELTFRELLRHVREVALGAFAHQDVPFELLVEDLQPQRDLNRNPLFQVMFAVQNTPAVELQIPGVSFGVQEFSTNATRFDLECHLRQVNDELRGQLVYCTDLFEQETIERLLCNYESLLESVVSNPDRRVSEFSLLTPEEEHTLLVDWNRTNVDFPRDKRVHDLFEEQAARTPEAIAVESGSELVSYAELDDRANRWASRLRKLGVGPNSIVGVAASSSVGSLSAILGVLKAGGAYLPLDSTYPAARLDYMLENSRAQVLIIEPSLRDRFSFLPAHVIEIDEEPDETSEARLSAQASSGDLAYVIYTSGSTGKPKGVAMPHTALVNLLQWQMARSAPAPRTLQLASLSFDVSFQEMFSTWGAGGTLVLIEEEDRRDLFRLWSVLTERRIERLFLPFVALQYLAEISARDETAELPVLREIVTAGEQLKTTPQIRQLLARLSGCVFDNEYGPTEAHAVSVYRMPDKQEAWSELPPIGQPIANTQLYILDAQMRPGPLGVAGELYIAGDCLARGYVNSPERTAERFLPNPFSREPGTRMYRTGDLARFWSDGNIQFLGRRDGQMKIRGYRVEAGEIEAVICGHSLVREAVVLAQSRPGGASELVAYVLLKEGAAHDASELRGYVKERLPDYMLPTSFIALEEFPLTPSGKVDRRRLPELGQPELIQQSEPASPSRPTEELVANIWSEVLGIERVSSGDNFFEIGGHSLLATRVIARLREVFMLEVPLRRLFEMPTISELATYIDTELRVAGTSESQPPITRASKNDVLPLSFAQERLWFWEQLQPGTPTYTLTSAFRLEGELDVAVLERCLNEIMRRHVILRTSYEAVDGRPVILIAPHSFTRLSVKDLSHLPESERHSEVRRLAGEEGLRPFDLTRSPLLRVNLLRLGEQEHVALVSMHHIVSDGWSIGVLVDEIATLYEEFLAGRPSPLAELPVQYADFAKWQREWLKGDVLNKQLTYWKEQLRDAPLLELRTDRPRPKVFSSQGSTVPINLPAGLLRELKALSRKQNVTLFMTLLAAFNVLLHRHTGQDDIVVGTDIANRTQVETEKLIGFFVNMLVLRTNLKGDPTFTELLRRVREMALGAYMHQDVPFARLVDEFHLRRELTRNPLFQVVFVLQNAPLKNLELTGITLTPVEFEVKTTPFDLIFALSETADSLVGSVTYSTELFDKDTVRQLIGHYQNVLQGVVAAPDQPLSSLAILQDSEVDSQAVSNFDVKLNRKDLEGVLLELSQASHSH
jgi:amino acid adenylation domain-containing protein